MRRKSKSKSDDIWLKEFGQRLELLIRDRGYNSIYDFWTQEGHKHVSRATMNYIVAGEVDPKLTTVRNLINQLEAKNDEISSLIG